MPLVVRPKAPSAPEGFIYGIRDERHRITVESRYRDIDAWSQLRVDVVQLLRDIHIKRPINWKHNSSRLHLSL